MKISTTFFLLLFALLQYRLWFGNGSLTEVQELDRQTQQLQQDNKQLEERNLSLTAEVFDLKHGQAAIEERARSEMGMIKNNETFYQIVDYSGFQSSQTH